MEYLLFLLVIVFIGLILERKMPNKYRFVVWGYRCFTVLVFLQLTVLAPYRFYRILGDLALF